MLLFVFHPCSSGVCSLFITSHSESELEGELHKARRGGLYYLAELSAGNVAVNGCRTKKLRVIEDVKGFQPELQRLRFRQMEELPQREIGVEHPGTVERAPRSIAWSSQRVEAEERSIEIGQPISRIPVELERAGRKIR
jgi:hypothetical protein